MNFAMLARCGRTALLAASCVALVALLSAGCDFVPTNPDDGGGDIDTNGTQPVPGPSIAIRFANSTDLAVLADVYVSTNGADLTPEVIFAPANQLTDGVGLASTGVLVPDSTDAVEIPCSAGMVVATTGGVFRDPDTGEELGTGTQRILQEGFVFDCEAEITFVYREVDGEYTVVVTLN